VYKINVTGKRWRVVRIHPSVSFYKNFIQHKNLIKVPDLNSIMFYNVNFVSIKKEGKKERNYM